MHAPQPTYISSFSKSQALICRLLDQPQHESPYICAALQAWKNFKVLMSLLSEAAVSREAISQQFLTSIIFIGLNVLADSTSLPHAMD